MSKSIQLKDSSGTYLYPNPYFPVGSIYLSVSDTNPKKWFSGTWELIAQGRTLVGVDTSDSNFSTVKKTGGSKYLQSHSHLMKIASNAGAGGLGAGYGVSYYQYDRYPTSWNNGISGSGEHTGFGLESTGTGNSGNLQPYFTCYIWCRTA